LLLIYGLQARQALPHIRQFRIHFAMTPPPFWLVLVLVQVLPFLCNLWCCFVCGLPAKIIITSAWC
jgi:hypothetical protein